MLTIALVAALSLLAQDLERPPQPPGREPVPLPSAGSPAGQPYAPSPPSEEVDGRALLQQGRVAEAEAWFWERLEACPWKDARFALGIVDCMRRTGRLAELDSCIAQRREAWLASGEDCYPLPAYVPLVAARALDRFRARGDLDLLWNVLAGRSGPGVPAEELSPIGSGDLRPPDGRLCWELVYCGDSFRGHGLRQAALEAILSMPQSARARAWSAVTGKRSPTALVVLASLHDERARPRLFAKLQEIRRIPCLIEHGWTCYLLAVEGSWASYDFLEGEAASESWTAAASRVVLDHLPAAEGSTEYSFETWSRLEDALVEAGYYRPRCGRGRF